MVVVRQTRLSCKYNSPTDCDLLFMILSLLSVQAESKQMTSGKRTLVSGHLVSWEASAAFPLAQIRARLGQAGELATETQVAVLPQQALVILYQTGHVRHCSSVATSVNQECISEHLTPHICAHSIPADIWGGGCAMAEAKRLV